MFCRDMAYARFLARYPAIGKVKLKDKIKEKKFFFLNFIRNMVFHNILVFFMQWLLVYLWKVL
jgi:hypothetical protein